MSDENKKQAPEQQEQEPKEPQQPQAEPPTGLTAEQQAQIDALTKQLSAMTVAQGTGKSLMVGGFPDDGLAKTHEVGASTVSKSQAHPMSRPRWNIASIGDAGQTQFDIRLGTGPTIFSVVGSQENAAAVIVALALVDRVQRNAMRAAAAVEGSQWEAVVPLNNHELGCLREFFTWLRAYGDALLTSGRKPWDGKMADGGTTGDATAAVTVMKGDGGNLN